MTTPQERRNLRLKNDYREMLGIQGPIVTWRPVRGNPPHVEKYELTVNIRTIIGPGPQYRERHDLLLTVPPNYPLEAPHIQMISRPQPYHPNWFASGNWCYGSFSVSEGLGHYVVRMLRTLQFDEEITNAGSPANNAARDWYVANRSRSWFPCDRQPLPDPSTKRFVIHGRIRPGAASEQRPADDSDLPPSRRFRIHEP